MPRNVKRDIRTAEYHEVLNELFTQSKELSSVKSQGREYSNLQKVTGHSSLKEQAKKVAYIFANILTLGLLSLIVKAVKKINSAMVNRSEANVTQVVREKTAILTKDEAKPLGIKKDEGKSLLKEISQPIVIQTEKTVSIQEEKKPVFRPPFPVVFKVQALFGNPEPFLALKREVEEYNQHHPQRPLKFGFGHKFAYPDEAVKSVGTEPIWVGYTSEEINTLFNFKETQFLEKYFRSGSRSIFDDLKNATRFTAELVHNPLPIDEIEKTYHQLPKTDSSLLSVNIPKGDIRDDGEMKGIFSSILNTYDGVVIGETHTDRMARNLIAECMSDFAEMGIKTLFLEFCCYDSAIQEELDTFFKTKKASPFLEAFLNNGYGFAVGEGNSYYRLVKEAVQAGIRPIGLETARTRHLGYEKREGARRNERMLGLNVPAVEIITKHRQDGKFMALVGSGHLSYNDSVAGLSELCGVPNVLIESASLMNSKFGVEVNVRNLNITDHEEIKKTFGENQHDHLVHVRLSL